MIDYLLALTTVSLAWWLSTGVVLYLNHRSQPQQRASLAVATGIAIICLINLPARSEDLTALGALLGFGQGLLIWAWMEMTYLMGVVTGPRKIECPESAGNWLRFWYGLQTSLYHELAVLTLVLLVVSLSSGPNQVAAATYAALWLMRWSTKLNLFLGVRNYNKDWFPDHMAHLDSYTRRAPLNPLMPLSVTVGTVVAVTLLVTAIQTTDPFLRASNLLLSALLSLGVLEHWFLVFPFGESALWRWALKSRRREEKPLASVHQLNVGERAS